MEKMSFNKFLEKLGMASSELMSELAPSCDVCPFKAACTKDEYSELSCGETLEQFVDIGQVDVSVHRYVAFNNNETVYADTYEELKAQILYGQTFADYATKNFKADDIIKMALNDTLKQKIDEVFDDLLQNYYTVHKIID